MSIAIEVPATSANLGPGFDTLGVAINLHNKIVIKKSSFFSLSIKGEGSNRKKFKSNNLFVHIFYKIFNELNNNKKENFRFEFYNHIPVSRGLGSSSAIITSAICAAYAASGIEISKKDLLNKALEFETHPDNISPAVYGGFTVNMIENREVFTQKKEMPSYLKAVVVIPDKAMSTARSRNVLPKTYNIKDIVYNLSRSSFLTAAFFNENWEYLKIASKDRIHQNQRMLNLKELFDVQQTALDNGALLSTLSGSGSTFFNIAYEDDAKMLAQKLKDRFQNFKIEIFEFDNIGLKVKF